MVIFYFLFFLSLSSGFFLLTLQRYGDFHGFQTHVRRTMSNYRPIDKLPVFVLLFIPIYIYKNENRGRYEGGLNSNDYLYQDLNNRVA